jgi:AcrR family transcriptional regulator
MPPQRAQARQRTPRETARDAFRAALREGAERVFARAGYQATKMTDIARDAGVAVGTLYNYFDSKEEIFQEIFLTRSHELHARLAPALAAACPLDRLRGVLRMAFAFMDEHGALFAMFVERGGTAEYDLHRLGGDVVQAEYERFLRLLLQNVEAAARAGRLRRDLPPALLVAALSGAMNGLTYAWLQRRRRGRLAAQTDALFDLFLTGARASS